MSGLLARVFGGGEPPAFDTWTDPPMTPPSNANARRLHGYAKKCAGQLQDMNVPLFRSLYPRQGKDTYVDAFWVVALSPEGASRQHIRFVMAAYKPDRGMPPATKVGEYNSHLRGKALLLTKSGGLASADVEGWLLKNGRLSDSSMDFLFHDVAYSEDQMLYEDWGYFNRGRWRPAREKPYVFHGVATTGEHIRFEERWRSNGENDRTGKGTSATLSRFVKSGGKIQWPRNFPDFDYD